MILEGEITMSDKEPHAITACSKKRRFFSLSSSNSQKQSQTSCYYFSKPINICLPT